MGDILRTLGIGAFVLGVLIAAFVGIPTAMVIALMR